MILDRTTLAEFVNRCREQGQRIVFTNGTFDILHAGHVQYLAEAVALGDCLIVAINSDASARRLKGPGRPVNNESDRAAVVDAIKSVTWVTIFDEDTPHALLELLRPDVLVKGGDYAGPHEVVGHEVVEGYGGKVLVATHWPGLSSTAIGERLGQSALEDGPYTRDKLVAICDAAVVPQTKWANRDSPAAHAKLGLCWVMLKSGCQFWIDERETSDGIIWLSIQWKTFSSFEYAGGHETSDHFYLPTPKRLRDRLGQDWY